MIHDNRIEALRDQLIFDAEATVDDWRALVARLSDEQATSKLAIDAGIEVGTANATLRAKLLEALHERDNLRDRADHLERRLRELLWLTHGHTALYGDDGEMQCSTCWADYRRDPLPELERKAEKARHA